MRNVLAVLAGLVVGAIVIALGEYLGHLWYPLPEGTDPRDPAALKAAIATMPAAAFVPVLIAWAVGAFVFVPMAWLGGKLGAPRGFAAPAS